MTMPPTTGRLGVLGGLGELWVVRALISSAFISAVLTVGVLFVYYTSTAVTQNVVMIFLINLVVVVGLQTFTGNSGVVSFGHVAFMAIGAYATAITTTSPAIKQSLIPDAPSFLIDAELSFVPAMAIAVAVTSAIALPIGFVFARLTGAAAAIATLAWLVIARTVIANWDRITAGTFTFYGIPSFTTIGWALGLAILAITVASLFRESGLGLSLRATSNDPLVARAVGVSVTSARLAAWVLSAAIAGLGGVLYAHFILALAPTAFYFELTFIILVMLIVGGRSVSAAVLGAAAISVISEVLRRTESATERFGTSTLVLAAIFMTMMILRSEGLLGRWELDQLVARSWGRFRRGRVGDRAQVPPPVTASTRGDRTPPTRTAVGEGEPEIMKLEVDGLSKDFGRVHALAGVNLSLVKGDILAVIGPNGSGKTTLINVVSGVIPPTSGTARLDEVVLTELPSHKVARRGIGRTFQNIRLFRDMTVIENVETAASRSPRTNGFFRPRSASREALALVGLEDLAETIVGTLPYGLQRRVEIARAIASRPHFVLLDEPAAGLNEAESDALLDVIRLLRDRLGVGILVVDHDLRLIMRVAERILVLNEGKTLAAGTPHQVRNNRAVIEAYLGSEYDHEHLLQEVEQPREEEQPDS